MPMLARVIYREYGTPTQANAEENDICRKNERPCMYIGQHSGLFCSCPLLRPRHPAGLCPSSGAQISSVQMLMKFLYSVRFTARQYSSHAMSALCSGVIL